jgi:O-antigen/teichoic acid export membrane protein
MTRNTAWAFAGNSVYAGCQWLVFVLLVRKLPVDEVGAFAYAMAITAPVFVLAGVRLRNLLATSGDAPDEFFAYLTARLMTTTAAIVVAIALGALLVHQPRFFGVVALMACGRACDAVSDICHGLFQRQRDMRSAAVGLAINGLASLLLVGAAVATFASVTTATAAFALGSLAALAGWDVPGALRRARPRRPGHAAPPRMTSADRLRTVRSAGRLVRRASPLGVSSAIGSVETNLPRYAIASALGPGPLGVFAALSHLVMLGDLIVNAVCQAALPMLAIDLKRSPRRFAKRLSILLIASLVFGVTMLAVAALFGMTVIVWIYGDAYASYGSVLLWLVGAAVAGFASVFLGAGTMARQRFGAQPVISAASLAIVATTIAPLVARYGLNGAAVSLFGAAIVELIAYLGLTAWDLRVGRAAPFVGEPLAGGAQS